MYTIIYSWSDHLVKESLYSQVPKFYHNFFLKRALINKMLSHNFWTACFVSKFGQLIIWEISLSTTAILYMWYIFPTSDSCSPWSFEDTSYPPFSIKCFCHIYRSRIFRGACLSLLNLKIRNWLKFLKWIIFILMITKLDYIFTNIYLSFM